MKTLVGSSSALHQGPLPTALMESVRDGLPISEFDALRELLGVVDRDLAQAIGISVPTLFRRRRAKERLNAQASDRLVRLARLFWQAVAFFEGNETAARHWLHRPAPNLGGLSPMAAAETGVGAAAVEQLLGRLEHGVLA